MGSQRKASIQVDASKKVGALAHNWTYIGFDECNYAYIPESEELLEKFRQFKETPYYVRTHHIFCTGNCNGFYKWGSTNCYLEDENGNPVYNWKYIDLIFDTLLKHDTKPFVELGFMPMDLVDPAYLEKFSKIQGFTSDYKMYQQYGWACPPKDYNKWYDLVYNFIRHLIERHGEDEIAAWYFELWNEPDIPYWHGTHDDYNKLYDYTAAAVKAASPRARVGGPSVTNPVHRQNSAMLLENFLNHTRNGVNYYNGEKGTVVDFTTFHVKGAGYPMAPKATQKSDPPSVRRMMDGIKVGYEIIKKYGYDNVECILSEIDPDGWAAGGTGDNINFEFRNTEYYPSFVVDSFDKASKFAKENNWDLRLLTWAYMFPSERAFEGTRVFTTQGIDKAILNLFRMYAMIGSEAVSFTSSGEKDVFTYEDMNGMKESADIAGFATSDGKSVQVLVYNHHDNWDLKETWDVDVEIENLPFEGAVTVEHFRVDADHSNAYAEWVRQGKPMYPQGDQMAAIKAREGLELLAPSSQAQVKDGKVKLSFALPVHGISLLHLTSRM